MSIEDWLPIKSSDPTANAAIAVVLAMVAITLVVVGGMFLLPVVLIIGIAKGVHWYVNRPTPTDQLYAQTQQRGLSANFPDAEKYIDAFLACSISAGVPASVKGPGRVASASTCLNIQSSPKKCFNIRLAICVSFLQRSGSPSQVASRSAAPISRNVGICATRVSRGCFVLPKP
jgi:hypothetical protein